LEEESAVAAIFREPEALYCYQSSYGNKTMLDVLCTGKGIKQRARRVKEGLDEELEDEGFDRGRNKQDLPRGLKVWGSINS
jgi:3-methyladenine DNA glycosylase Mpg